MRFKAIILCVLFCGIAHGAAAQQAQTREQQEKQLYENIQKQVDDMTSHLDLADWQVFYTDSILTHNYGEMSREFEELSNSKVSNTDLYYVIQDKWMEETYNALHKVFNDEQWAKYLKSGGARDKKARDKRAAKRENKK